MKTPLTIFYFLLIFPLYSQNNPLPQMTDWFLSTGDWGNDPQLYIREYGKKDGDPIIMLHGGWGAEHKGMIESVKDLADEHRFIFYDQRGSLRSPFPDSLITFENHIEDIERLRIELNLEKITLVGHSMGAVLASAYAAKYPDQIKRLVLLAPAYLKNPIPENSLELLNEQRNQQQKFMERNEVKKEFEKYALNREDASSLSSRANTADFRINFANRMLYDITKWSMLTGGRALYKGHVFGLTEASYPKDGWNFFEDFKKGTYPISIIIGDHDFLDFGNGLINSWVKEVSRIQLSTIENAGHIIWIDQPKVFSMELKKSLTD